MTLNERLKDAVASVRQFGEPIEVFWQFADDADSTGEPWDQDRNGPWLGDLLSMKDLRRWLKGRTPDNRNITIYCRGDSRDVAFDIAL